MRVSWKEWSLESKLALMAIFVALLFGLLGPLTSLYPDRTRSMLETPVFPRLVFFPVPLWLVVFLVAGTVLLTGLLRKTQPSGRRSVEKPPLVVDDDELSILKMLVNGEEATVILMARANWLNEKFQLVIGRLMRKSLILVRSTPRYSTRPETIRLSHAGREFLNSHGDL